MQKTNLLTLSVIQGRRLCLSFSSSHPKKLARNRINTSTVVKRGEKWCYLRIYDPITFKSNSKETKEEGLGK